MTFSSKLFCIWSIKFYNIRALFSHILLFNENQNVHNTAGSFKNSNENANSFWFRKKLCLVIWWSMELFFTKISSFILPHLCMYGVCMERHHVYAAHMSFFSVVLTGTWCMWLSFTYEVEINEKKWIQREHSMCQSSNNRWTHMWWEDSVSRLHSLFFAHTCNNFI